MHHIKRYRLSVKLETITLTCKSFMKPFKPAFKKTSAKWMRMNEPSINNSTPTCTTQQHLITSTKISSNTIAATTTPSTTATLPKISLTSGSNTKSEINDGLHVLSPIPNKNNIRSRKAQ